MRLNTKASVLSTTTIKSFLRKISILRVEFYSKIHELNRIDLRPMDVEGKVFSGAYLMNHGLEMPYRNEPEWSKKNDWSSRVLLLEAQ